ncbi:MAG: hypothetical protein RSF69_05370 [Erysipelotrichaceae bacterium]
MPSTIGTHGACGTNVAPFIMKATPKIEIISDTINPCRIALFIN